MYRPIFGYSFAGLVIPILFSALAFNFLNKKKSIARRNAEDADTGASGSSTAPMGSDTDASSLSTAETETNKGASSSSTAPTGNCYDVFLSFSGADIPEGFIDLLYNRLVDAGIHAFKYDNELCQGQEIDPVILAAIKNSKMLIPILSMNYCSNKWCLDELVHMMECKKNQTGQIVLPIFYKVKPAAVPDEIGSFVDSFYKREKHFDPTILEKWKQALKEVSSLKEWEAEGYGLLVESVVQKGVLVKSVVRKVLSELKKDFQLVVSEDLVGIDSHVRKVMNFVDDNSTATLFIGIHGMGGIGKTTLAKIIYNKLSNQFAYCSFIADIRELCQRNSLEYLQNQLISDILKRRSSVSNKVEGIRMISSRFPSKKVLIVLDDVDGDDQINAMAGNHNWFSLGSKIIITTRNKCILDNARVDYKYEHSGMDQDQSLILFSRHAFRRDFPPSEFEVLTHDVVSTIGGLPLSLEVLGSFLHGKRFVLWRSTINKLRKVPPPCVREKLMITYEALGNEEKQIFLDIACFCMGTNVRITSYIWGDCDFFPKKGIEVLMDMSLIKVGENHELKMHDQLRDLGRDIVRQESQLQPQYRSRLWDASEVLKVLKENKGTEKIEAIYFNKVSSECSGNAADPSGDIYTSRQFENLTRLRFLHMNGAHFMGDFKNSIEKLRWLRWWNCPLTFEANNFDVMELAVLDLSGSGILDEWEGWNSIMMAKKLKVLNLTSCQSLRSPFFLSAFKNLEVLILQDCEKVERIDFSIGDMKNLVRLDLSGCRRLKELPVEVGDLKALVELLLKGTNIKELPYSIGGLQNLEILNISGTGIKELPNSIVKLRKLRDLDASRCQKLGGEVPRSMHNLSSVQHLDFDGCEFMEILDVSQLNHLKTLSAKGCKNIVEVRGLDKLKYLVSLSITGSTSIESLDLSKSEGLRILYANNCTNLVEIQGLDGLESLEGLYISGCISVERLDLPKSKRLKILDVGNCENLVEIQGLDRLEFMKELCIPQCTSIESLNLPKSKNLKKLYADKCISIVEIRDINRLEFLEELCVSKCVSIKRLDLRKSKLLKILDARDCKSLVEIQGLDGLEFCEKLNISECTSIKRIDLPKFNSLKILYAENCKNLIEIQGLNRLEFLEDLNISKCTSIERLNLSKSKGLNKLHVENCKSLVEIQGLDGLESLEEVNVSGCALLKRLDLSKSKSLNKLYADNCESIAEIQGLERLELLEELHISGCISIKRLKLPKSESLSQFYAKNCRSLEEIQGLDKLEFLEELYISECASIKRLDVSKSKGLNKLYIENCESLVEIQSLDGLEFLEEVYIFGCTSLKVGPWKI